MIAVCWLCSFHDCIFFFFKQKTAYEMRISDWSSDVCSSDLVTELYADQMELRALVSAADAGKAFDLRCDVREAMMAFITSEMPEAMVRRRGDLRISADRSQSANGGSAAPPEHAFTVTDLAHRPPAAGRR